MGVEARSFVHAKIFREEKVRRAALGHARMKAASSRPASARAPSAARPGSTVSGRAVGRSGATVEHGEIFNLCCFRIAPKFRHVRGRWSSTLAGDEDGLFAWSASTIESLGVARPPPMTFLPAHVWRMMRAKNVPASTSLMTMRSTVTPARRRCGR